MEKRKKNRLEDYDYNQPGAYFITVCVKDRKPILSAIVGADDHIGPQVQLTQIGQVVERYTRSVPGVGHYVIMPNHVHMILHISAKTPGDGPMWSSAPTDVNISTVMRTWKTLITKELGQSIFQRSYYDHVIRDEQSYVEIAEYIMGNPGKWAEDKYFFASKG